MSAHAILNLFKILISASHATHAKLKFVAVHCSTKLSVLNKSHLCINDKGRQYQWSWGLILASVQQLVMVPIVQQVHIEAGVRGFCA